MSLAASLQSLLDDPKLLPRDVLNNSNSSFELNYLHAETVQLGECDGPNDDFNSSLTSSLPRLVLKKLEEASLKIPPYGERANWRPRHPEDYGDGGAFPEIHIPQYPLDMGRNISDLSTTQSLIPLTYDSEGNASFDSLIQHSRAPGTIVHSKPSAAIGVRFDEEELTRQDPKELQENIQLTRKAIEQRLESKLIQTNHSLPPEGTTPQKPQLVRYTPSIQNPNFNSGASQRLIKIVDRPVDPLEPPKFKSVKDVTSNLSGAHVPILHSPPKKATKEEKDAWFIPPNLSNWNNSKGFTVSLDKRLANEGRGIQETVISPNFARISAALDAAQATAREQIAFRAAVQQQKLFLQREQEERQAREIAQLARLKRAGIRAEAESIETPEELEARLARDVIREEHRRQRDEEERGKRMGSASRQINSIISSIDQRRDRDISEKIALGQSVPRSQQSLFDERLYNQSQGLDHGYVNDEDYNAYEKPLFTSGREQALYKAPDRHGEIYQQSYNMDKLLNTARFKADKPFSGTGKGPHSDQSKDGDDIESSSLNSHGRRSGPVQFERDNQDVLEQVQQAEERKRILSHQQSTTNQHSPIRRDHHQPSERDYRRQHDDRYHNHRGDDAQGPDPSDDPMDAMLTFMSDAKSNRKRERAQTRGTLGHMGVVAGSSGNADDLHRSKRTGIDFI